MFLKLSVNITSDYYKTIRNPCNKKSAITYDLSVLFIKTYIEYITHVSKNKIPEKYKTPAPHQKKTWVY